MFNRKRDLILNLRVEIRELKDHLANQIEQLRDAKHEFLCEQGRKESAREDVKAEQAVVRECEKLMDRLFATVDYGDEFAAHMLQADLRRYSPLAWFKNHVESEEKKLKDRRDKARVRGFVEQIFREQNKAVQVNQGPVPTKDDPARGW